MNITSSKPANAKPTPHPSTLFPEIQTCKTLRQLKQVHASFVKSGKIHDPLAAAEFLRFSAYHRHLHNARLLFHQMIHPNCFSYNTIIRALSESDDHDDAEEALKIFVQMLHDEFVNPNGFTFPSLLKACASSARIEEGKQIHGLVVKMGFDGHDDFVLSNLLRTYVMCCAMEDASVLFKTRVKSRSKNVVFWNVMIDGYMRIGDFEAAKQLFDRMPHRSVVSWNGVIAGYAQNGLFKEALGVNFKVGVLELGKWVHLYADKNEIEIDEKLGSALIDMYSKCGSIDKAIQLFLKLPLRNVVAWNAIIGGLAMHGRAKDALDYFSKMGREGILPNDITYIGVLSACSHAGLVEEGQQFFDQMMRSGLEPRMEHYGCMVDLLGRAGLF
ncbi:Pentatricopeptide repeat [Dillenia turbinata]|uniref:Pentatricopeptide repeat n=1 Tax=Dillenia turbinata TaxID=194707 RepID=A0AAN8URG1_9MAGN